MSKKGSGQATTAQVRGAVDVVQGVVVAGVVVAVVVVKVVVVVANVVVVGMRQQVK
jgi:hypothetical protein